MTNTSDINDFFLITLPGLEGLAARELEEKSVLYEQALEKITASQGGVSFQTTSIEQGFYVNHYSKIGTRLLLRINSFKVRDFPKLYNKLAKIDWNKYISGSSPKVVVNSKNSKIFDDRKVEKCLHDAMKKFFIGSGPKKKYIDYEWPVTPTVFLRFIDDTCTVSIDTSGERLDRRGKKLFTSKAPIRESIASAMYYHLKTENKKFNNIDNRIIDPMCGSGTLLFEFENFYKLNYDRYFLYQDFPKVQVKKIRVESSTAEGLNGYDLSEEMISVANRNKENWEESLIEFSTKDIFKNTENFSKDFIVVNPPYNKRIKTNMKINDFIDKLVKKLISENKASDVCLVMPDSFIIPKISGLKVKKSKRINNGGIWVSFFQLSN